MITGVFRDIINYHGPMKTLLAFDVDLTLRPTMSTDTPPEEHALMTELYCRLGGGVVIMTGRSSSSADKTLSGQFPGSFEHHSAIRLEQGGKVHALAPSVNTNSIAAFATEFINGHISVANGPEQVRQSEGLFSCVYPEVKEFAVALVHSLGHDKVEDDRKILIGAAEYAIKKMGINETHKIAIGNDAIEVVPRGLCISDASELPISLPEIERLKSFGLNKGMAIHNFMNHQIYSGRTPYVAGDSGTDGVAMNEAFNHYSGGGIWVKNGHNVPERYMDAVGSRTIKTYLNTWSEIAVAVQDLRAKTKIIILPNDLKANLC